MKHNGHLTFEPVIDSRGARSVENITSGAILSLDVVYVRVHKCKDKLRNLGIIEGTFNP